MLELFETAIKSSAGSFAFVLSMLAICFLGVWKISHFTTKFNSVEKLEVHIGSIKEDLHYLKGSIKLITDSNNPFAQRQSPVSMTQKGIEVASDLNLNDIIINHWDFISSLLNKVLNKDCNPYDIQIESFKIGEKYQEYVNDSELKIVKNHAFKSGYNLESYNLLFGIVIRDKYLSSKGLKSSDVDLYDPNIK